MDLNPGFIIYIYLYTVSATSLYNVISLFCTIPQDLYHVGSFIFIRVYNPDFVSKLESKTMALY